MDPIVQTSEYEPINNHPKVSLRYERNQERYREQRGLNELEHLDAIVKHVEAVTGELSDWQQFYIIAAVSGRGVEWSQTRRGSHYHIVGLPCAVCGGR